MLVALERLSVMLHLFSSAHPTCVHLTLYVRTDSQCAKGLARVSWRRRSAQTVACITFHNICDQTVFQMKFICIL